MQHLICQRLNKILIFLAFLEPLVTVTRYSKCTIVLLQHKDTKDCANDIEPVAVSAYTLSQTQPARSNSVTHRAILLFAFFKSLTETLSCG